MLASSPPVLMSSMPALAKPLTALVESPPALVKAPPLRSAGYLLRELSGHVEEGVVVQIAALHLRRDVVQRLGAARVHCPPVRPDELVLAKALPHNG
eukprot:2253313-Pyramimonas_sp.AAC.1